MLGKNDLQDIIKENKKELKKNPNDKELLQKIADAYYSMGDFKNAKSYFTDYLTKADPTNSEIWHKLGLSYKEMNKNKDAIEAFKKSLQYKEDFDEPWVNLARINVSEKNFDQAVQQYRQACEINTENKDYWFEYGQCLLEKKLYSGAVKSFKRALRLDKNLDKAWDDLAEVYKKTGQKEKSKLAMSQNWNLLDENFLTTNEREKINELERRLIKLEKVLDKEQYTKAKKELESILKEAESYYFEEIMKEASIKLELCKEKISEERRAKEIESIEHELELDLTNVAKLVKNQEYTKAKTILYAIIKQATENELDSIFVKANREFDRVAGLEFEQGAETPGALEGEQFNKNEIEVLRGGDWKVEEDQSVFYYKPKIINNSKFVITNIQILLTQIPSCLEIENDRYKIDVLRPRSFEAPTFKLRALESCVGDTIGAILTYTTPSGTQETRKVLPFEIEYVCNLLVPQHITRKDFEKKIRNMDTKELVIDSGLDIEATQTALTTILLQNNFFLLEQLKKSQSRNHRTLDGFAQGRYDKEEVALSLTMDEQEDTTQVKITGMSERVEKLTDLLRDINVKCDSIKSDTVLIKQYTEQISDLIDGIEDLEKYLKKRIGSDFDQIKVVLDDYRRGDIKKGAFIAKCIGVLGKRFIKAFPVIGKLAIPA